jgi:tetratricopeptide (TPR) repeat protein
MLENERIRLDSWGEIAQYLRRDIRTVKRWEKEKGLPVRRLPGGKRQVVFAYQDEIDQWSSSAAVQNSSSPLTVIPPSENEGKIDSLANDPKRDQDAGKARAPNSLAVTGSRFTGVFKNSWRFGVLLLLAGIIGLLIYRRPLHDATNAKFTASTRQTIAVLSSKNLSGKTEDAWLRVALAEWLTSELSLPQALRTIREEDVFKMEADLQLPSVTTYSPSTLKRIKSYCNADFVVTSAYARAPDSGNDNLRVDIWVQSTTSGDVIAHVSETASLSHVFDLVSHSGNSLRQQLAIREQSTLGNTEARNSMPKSVKAERLYALGLEKLRQLEPVAAKDLLEEAAIAEPDFPLVHAALAESWSRIGYDQQASEEAGKAFKLSENLSEEQRLLIQGSFYEMMRDWAKAIGSYRALFSLFPDDVNYGLRLAEAQGFSGDSKGALETLDSLKRLATGDDPRIDLAECGPAQAIAQIERAYTAAERAANKSLTRGNRSLYAQALVQKGRALWILGRSQEAIKPLEDAKSAFHDGGDKLGAAAALNNIGLILMDRGNFTGARNAHQEALQLRREIGNLRGVAGSLNNIGLLLDREGEFAEARRYYEQSLEIRRNIGDKAGAAGALGNIANILEYQADLEESRKMHELSLNMIGELDKRIDPVEEQNIAIVLQEQGKLADAKSMFQNAVDTSRAIHDPGVQAAALVGLGDVLLLKGDFAGAYAAQHEALEIRQKDGETTETAESYVELAKVALAQSRPIEAENLSRRALTEFLKEKNRDGEIVARCALAEALLAKRTWTEANRESAKAAHIAERTQYVKRRLTANITAARILIASSQPGDLDQALRYLAPSLKEARSHGLVFYRFKGELLLAEIERRTGHLASARSRLEELQKQATAAGFAPIAHEAALPVSNR